MATKTPKIHKIRLLRIWRWKWQFGLLIGLKHFVNRKFGENQSSFVVSIRQQFRMENMYDCTWFANQVLAPRIC